MTSSSVFEQHGLRPPPTLCGARIAVYKYEGSHRSEQRNRATIGGVFRIGQRYMALTVAHVFFDNVSSSGSWADSGLYVTNSSSNTSQPGQPRVSDLYEIRVEEFWPHDAVNEDKSPSGAISMGLFQPRLTRQRHMRRQIELSEVMWNFKQDWALIELREPWMWTPNILQADFNTFTQLEIPAVDEAPPSQQLLVATGVSGFVKGMSLGTVGGILLPWSSEEVSVWSLEADIALGDCGSVVIEPARGAALGFAIAHDSQTMTTYYIPSRSIFESISTQCSLPQAQLRWHSHMSGSHATNPDARVAASVDEESSATALQRSQSDFILHEFKRAVQHCTLLTFDGKELVLLARLETWLSRQSVETATNLDLLLDRVYPPTLMLPVEAGAIRSGRQKAIAVFCILLELGRGDLIHEFQRLGLVDVRLPFQEEYLLSALVGIDQSHSPNLAALFSERQWSYCPLVLGYGASFSCPSRMVLPIVRCDPINTKGGTAEVLRVYVLQDYLDVEFRDKARAARITDGLNGFGPVYEFAVKSFSSSKRILFETEVEALKAISSIEGIVLYLGDFHTTSNNVLGEYNILLEYGDLDLGEYLTCTSPPVLLPAVTEFWKNLSAVAHTLSNIHSFTKKRAGLDKRYLGWHADIKPDNILIVHGRFKLSDLGFARFESSEKSITEVGGGTLKYSAPELDPGNGRRLASQAIDVWSLGCVFSEAATWIALGQRGCEQFERIRVRASERNSRLRTDSPQSDRSSFHNGTTLLPEVLEWHNVLRSVLKKGDTVTEPIMSLLEKNVLVGDPNLRLTIQELCVELDSLVSEAEATSGQLRPSEVLLAARTAFAAPSQTRFAYENMGGDNWTIESQINLAKLNASSLAALNSSQLRSSDASVSQEPYEVCTSPCADLRDAVRPSVENNSTDHVFEEASNVVNHVTAGESHSQDIIVRRRKMSSHRVKEYSKPLSNVPFRRDPDFVNRGTILDRIREQLTTLAGRAALVGLGGAGKSQLAIEYAHWTRESSPEKWVFWIHASNAARFEQGMRNVADMVKIEGREDPKAIIFKLVRDWLGDSANGQWMIVLDNVDDAGFLVEHRVPSEDGQGITNVHLSFFECLPVCDHGSILVTTRSESAALRLVERSDMIEVNPMDRATAMALLEKKLGKQEDEMDVLGLVEILEYMPLAITQAAAYINQRRRRCSVRQYVEKLRESDRSKRSVLDFDAGDLRRDREARNSIILTWQISFEQIRRDRPSAVELLSLMSFCDRQAIPEALLRKSNIKDGGSRVVLRDQAAKLAVENEESEYNEDYSDLEHFGNVDAGSDDGFDADLAMLEGYSFVSVTADASVFEMHGLVQLATKKWLESHGQLQYWNEQYIDHLHAVFPPGRYENWAMCRVLFPHAKVAMTQKPTHHEALLQWASVLLEAANYASTQGRSTEAEELGVQAMKSRKKVLGDEHADTLISMSKLSLTYLDQGRLSEAEELGARVLETCKKILGEEHPYTLASMGNLAATYRNRGRWFEAEELEVQVLAVRKKLLGDEHPETLTSMNNLALTYSDQGRFSEAEELGVRVLEARKRVLGLEHPDTLMSMSNLASTYWNQGRWAEAEELGVQVTASRKRVLGPEHPDTLTSMSNLASTYRNQGRWNEAEALEVQVLDIRKKVLGAEHPDTLTSMSNLASTYRNQGRWAEAEELGVQVTASRKRVLGPEHPDTLTSMGNLASTYSDQGRWKEAEELQIEVMRASSKLLGVDHPDTLAVKANLASTYRNRGRWKEAEELEIEVMRASSKLLGVDHPDTLTAKANLAVTYRVQGRWKEAEELEIEVMQARSKLLGVDHPDTLTAKANLASTYSGRGRWKEAEELQIEVMRASSKLLGVDHPDTLTAKANLAVTYSGRGRWKEAEELQIEVMRARSKLLGVDHPDTLTAKANLAVTYRDRGRWQEAEELQVEVLKARRLAGAGEEHLDILRATGELAHTYRKQFRLREAEDLYSSVLGLGQKLLGDEHPDMLTLMSNLAVTYYYQNHFQQAKELFVKIVDSRVRLLGQEHPETLSAIENLNLTYESLSNEKGEPIV